MKILFLGNSITLHSPAPDIGWHGNWGMAASCAENDYVHRLCELLENAGKHPKIRVRNIADFERDPEGIGMEWFADDIAFDPDVVILRISENTPDDKLDAFSPAYEALIRKFREKPGCRIFAVGPFWKRDRAEKRIVEAAAAADAQYLSLSSLHGQDQYRALGLFEHRGVASHPSDEGMAAIADVIFKGMEEAGLLSGAVIAPMPVPEAVYDGYTVTVDGKAVDLYGLRVSKMALNRSWPGHQRPIEQSELAAMLTFDMTAPVDIVLSTKEDIKEAVIRPLSKNVQAEIVGNKLFFTVREYGQYSVEINGRHHNLHLFANAPEADIPTPADCTHYFAPGVHDIGDLVLTSGARVYLAAGAVVYGAVQAYDAHDIRIWGRGILDGSKMERHEVLRLEKDGLINLVRCENVTIDGIILRDTSWWTITSFNCTNLTFRNCKAVGMWRYNSDGFDFVNCQNVHVDGCFLRNFDDVIVLKGLRLKENPSGCDSEGMITAQPIPYEHMNLQNYVIENCVLWCDWGGAMEMGAETVADEYANIVYRSCDIIGVASGAMRIQSGDRAHIHNVLYEDIRVEYSQYDRAPVLQRTDDTPYAPEDKPWVSSLIRIWMYCNVWSHDDILGEVYDVTYRNISVFADDGLPCPDIAISGGDDTHRAHDITIDGVTFNGVPVKPVIRTNEYTHNIIIKEKENVL